MFSYPDVNTNPSRSSSLSCQSFLTGVLLFKWIRSLQHPQDQVSVLLNGVCFIRPQVAFVFPPSHPFSSRTQIYNWVFILLMGSLSILFRQYSYPVILRKILIELQVHQSPFSFFPGGFKSSFVDHILFLVSNVFPYRCTS